MGYKITEQQIDELHVDIPKTVTFRATKETIRQLKALERYWGENKTQSVIRCIGRVYGQVFKRIKV